HYWLDVYAPLYAFAASCPNRALVVRYEDLTIDPDGCLRQVLDFIGEAEEPGLIARAFAMPHAEGFGDPHVKQTSGVHRDSVGRWARWPAAEAVALWET